MTPVFYLDTNVIRDNTKNRRQESIERVEKIRDNGWRCFTSVLALMEMIDNEQEDAFVAKKRAENMEYNTICRQRNQIDLTRKQLRETNDRFRAARRQYPFVRPVSLTEYGWRLALRIAATSNIFAPDAIHLAAAWQCRSNILLTTDDRFKKHGNSVLESQDLDKDLKICNPENTKRALAGMGFEVAR